MFKITNESLRVIQKISENMEGSTFHFHTHILYDIRTSLGENKIKYLEIGAYSGGSVSLVSSHYYPSECYSLDLGYPIEKKVVERNVEKFKNRKSSFRYIEGNSQSIDILEYVKDKIKEIDMLFIDGDHSKSGATKDFLNYSPLVKKGGYVIFDDYLDLVDSPEVKEAVNDIVNSLPDNMYEIIGSLNYDLIPTFTNLPGSNLFILRKI